MLLVGLLLVLSNLWLVLDAKMAVSSAARVGTQAFIEQNSFEEANSALQGTVGASLGRRFPSRWKATPKLSAFSRCAPVNVVVAVKVPLVAVPFVGAIGGTKTVSANHRSRVDPYRSRVPGEADCA